MKKKRNSFCKYLKLTLNKLKNSSMPSSQKEKRKLYYSPENEKEILSIKNKILNEKKTHKLQFSYCAFFAPNNILNLRKKSKISSNRTRISKTMAPPPECRRQARLSRACAVDRHV